MNQHINALLGPLEAATRSESWEDAEDIAREISRLARLERLKELEQIKNAILASRDHWTLNPYRPNPKTPPGGSQVAKTPLPVSGLTPIYQENTQVSARELLKNLEDKAKAAGWDIEELRKVATEALPAAPPVPIMQGESTPVGFHVEQWPFG